MAAGDRQPGLCGQVRQPGLPRPGPVPVRPARIGGDQQPPRRRVIRAAPGVPPAADRFHRERRGVVVGSHVHPPGVRGQVVDPVRDHHARLLPGEAVVADLDRVPGGPPLPARPGEQPHLLPLLGIDADHRLPRSHVLAGLRGDIPELGVPVRVLLPLDRLGVALQAEPFLPQQVPDRVRAGPVALPGQLGGQAAGGLDRPPQRRSRVPPLLRLHQRQQRRHQPRIHIPQPPGAPARPPRPPQRHRARSQLAGTQRDSSLADPGSTGDETVPAMPQRAGLRPHQQPPLPLIQMREDLPEHRRQRLRRHIHGTHTTPSGAISEPNGLSSCDYITGSLSHRAGPGPPPGRPGTGHPGGK